MKNILTPSTLASAVKVSPPAFASLNNWKYVNSPAAGDPATVTAPLSEDICWSSSVPIPASVTFTAVPYATSIVSLSAHATACNPKIQSPVFVEPGVQYTW